MATMTNDPHDPRIAAALGDPATWAWFSDERSAPATIGTEATSITLVLTVPADEPPDASVPALARS